MELNEAAIRILRGHRLLVVLCILLGLGAGWLVHGAEAKFCRSGTVSQEFPLTISTQDCANYSASTRLQLDLEPPRSLAESAAIADTARGIATSPGHVATALRKADAQRDPIFVARQAVKLNALGSSGILQLGVTDRDPETAAALANLLAADVVQTRTDSTRTQLQKAVADLDARMAELNRSIGELGARLSALEPRAGQLGTGEITNALTAQRTGLSAERASIESQRQTLVTTDALRPKAAIVDPAQAPLRRDRSHRPANLGLGLLLGLVIGIGGATLLEIFRPTLVGGGAIARALGVPRLGRISGFPVNGNLRDVPVRTHLRLAANAARVDTIELLPVDPSMDVHALAARLAGPPNGGGAQLAPAVHAFGPSSHPSSDTAAPGLVVVAPSMLKKARLDSLGDVRTITGWRMLGVVTYERPPWWKRLWLTASPPNRKGHGRDGANPKADPDILP